MIPPVTWSRNTWAWLQVSLALLHPPLNITSYIPLSYQQCPMEFQFFYLPKISQESDHLAECNYYYQPPHDTSLQLVPHLLAVVLPKETTYGAEQLQEVPNVEEKTVTDFWVQQIHAKLTLNFCGFQLFGS